MQFSSQARWVWQPDSKFKEAGRRLFFRKNFDLYRVPDKVALRITADSRYMLYVNGKFVSYGSERSDYKGSWPCDTVDIAPFLQCGRNVLAARVIHLAPDVFCQPAAHYGGLLFEAPEIGIYSDSDVKVYEPAGFLRESFKMSCQYADQEHADLKNIPAKWQETDFDDSAWPTTDYLRTSETEPYGRIVDRESPMPDFALISPQETLRTVWLGADVTGEEPITLYCKENPSWQQPDEAGNVSAVMYDFGRTRLGTILMEYENASGQETVDLLYTEAKLASGEPFLRTPADAGMVATASRIKLASGCGSHELDMPAGLRFLVAVIRGKSQVRTKFYLRNIAYPWQFTGKFHSSEPLLNDLYEMSLNTQLACASDTYTDCPWREQVQWWGDARIQAINTFALTTDVTLLRRGIRMLGETESSFGLTHAFAPATRWNTMIPDFSLCWVLTIYDDYFQTGETISFTRQYQRAAQVLNYFLDLRDDSGAFQKDSRYWNFYDWGFDHTKEPFPILGNMILLHTLEKVEILEKASGITADFDHTAAGKLRWYLRRYFQSGAGRKALAEPRSAAYAILDDLLEKKDIDFALDTISREIAVSENPTGASPYFIYYLFEALKKYGRAAEVINCIRKRWGFWHDLGLTTTPESWATEEKYGKTSLCHAWSAHIPAHFRDILLGVTQTAPGWKEIRFAPVYAGVNAVSGLIPTPWGNISVEIDHAAGKKNISLPPGITMFD